MPSTLIQACFPGAQDRLGSRGYLQFAEDVRDVIAHRLWTEHETRRDLWIGQVLRDQSEDFLFWVVKYRAELGGWTGHGGLEHGEVGHEPLGNGGAKDGYPLAPTANGTQDLRLERSLEQVAPRASLQGCEDRIVILEHGEHEDADVRTGRKDDVCRFDAVPLWHVQIHQDHIGLQGCSLFDGLSSRGGLTDRLDIRFRAEQRPQPIAERRMIIGDEHANTIHTVSSSPRETP